MSETQSLLTLNLSFYRLMRNRYYKKAWELFQQLATAVRGNQNEHLENVIVLIIHYTEVLELANEYARSTIRGYERKKIKAYSKDREFGVLEEEIVFVSLLEELLTSGIYLRNRFDTNENIHRYLEGIRMRTTATEDKKGFLANIINSMEADYRTDREEIFQSIKLIGKRFRTANNIFFVLRHHQTAGLAK